MSYELFVRHAAERDIAEALQWYESQQVGLSREFLLELETVTDFLSESPFMFPEKYRGVRRAMLNRFPFLVWYRVDGQRVTVLACTHGRLDPKAVSKRLS